MQGKYHVCVDRKEVGVINYDGGFAEYIKVPAKNVYKVPRGISTLEAVFTEPAATSVNGVIRTGIKFGDRVVVFGDGSIGLFAAQAALAQGASRVAVVARKNDNKDLIQSWNMDFINIKDRTIEDALNEIWGAKGDVAFEATGNADVIENALLALEAGGKLCMLSITGKEKVEVDLDSIVTKDITAVGVVASPNAFVPTLRMMAEGKIHSDGMLSKTYSLDRCVEAFDYVKNKKGPRIKVVVVKGDE